MNPYDPLAWIDAESAKWEAKGLRRRLRETVRRSATTVVRNGRTLVDFSANDYLGLAHDSRVIEAAAHALAGQGAGAGASPLVSGWTPCHARLAEELAQFEQAEAVALFPSGFAANLGTIVALVGREDVVYLDRWNHACLIDGARLSGATLRVYPHGDADRLGEILARDAGRFRRSLIATDGVFSMDGDLAPLEKLADLAELHEAMLMVDEAHGTGVFGEDGRGACQVSKVCDRVPIKVGTLSKALGSLGGFVAGSRRLVDHLLNHARPLIFSTALPASAAAAASSSLGIVRSEPELRERVCTLGVRLVGRLKLLGYNIPPVRGPIVPVLLGDAEKAARASLWLEEQGFLVPGIRPPTVPLGTARLRISLSAVHTDEQVDRLVQVLSDARHGAAGLLA